MRFRLRGFTSLLLGITFLVLSFSGIILYLTPKGRVAHWTGWTMLGLRKEEWAGLHINFALLFLIAGGLHWFLNWNLFWGYLKRKNALRLNLVAEIAVALVIAAIFLGGTVAAVPPLSTVVLGREEMENYWEVRSPRPPAPHAEEFNMRRFATAIGLSVEEVTQTLEEAGFDVPNDLVTVREVAEQKGLVPSDVLAVIQKKHPTAGSKKTGCRGRGKACDGP